MNENNEEAGISLTFAKKSKCSVSLHRKTVDELGEENSFQFLINMWKHTLALRVSRPGDKDAFDIVWDEENSCYRVRSQAFVERIYKLCCWDNEYSYRVGGKVMHYKNEKILVFDLGDSEKIEQEE